MSAHTLAAIVDEEPRTSGGFADVIAVLDGLIEVVFRIEPDVYVSRPAAAISGSIGEQVRHTIDHLAALLTVGRSGTLTYDHRERGTAVEIDPRAALQTLLHIKAVLEERADRSLADPVQVTARVSPSGRTVTGWSTMAREVAFVVSHTVHHQAIIALLLMLQGESVPQGFGVAPSTPRRLPS